MPAIRLLDQPSGVAGHTGVTANEHCHTIRMGHWLLETDSVPASASWEAER